MKRPSILLCGTLVGVFVTRAYADLPIPEHRHQLHDSVSSISGCSPDHTLPTIASGAYETYAFYDTLTVNQTQMSVERAPRRARHKTRLLSDDRILMPDTGLTSAYSQTSYGPRYEWYAPLKRGGRDFQEYRPRIVIEFLDETEATASVILDNVIARVLERLPSALLYSGMPVTYMKVHDLPGELAGAAYQPNRHNWPQFRSGEDLPYAFSIDLSEIVVRGTTINIGTQGVYLPLNIMHELAHLIDFRHNVTRSFTGPANHADFWDSMHNKRAASSEFVSAYAGDTGTHENFAETLVAWLALKSRRDNWQLHYRREVSDQGVRITYLNDGCSLADHIDQKALEEMQWWTRRFEDAAASATGRLFAP